LRSKAENETIYAAKLTDVFDLNKTIIAVNILDYIYELNETIYAAKLTDLFELNETIIAVNILDYIYELNEIIIAAALFNTDLENKKNKKCTYFTFFL